jgi:hypothetical protein
MPSNANDDTDWWRPANGATPALAPGASAAVAAALAGAAVVLAPGAFAAAAVVAAPGASDPAAVVPAAGASVGFVMADSSRNRGD